MAGKIEPYKDDQPTYTNDILEPLFTFSIVVEVSRGTTVEMRHLESQPIDGRLSNEVVNRIVRGAISTAIREAE